MFSEPHLAAAHLATLGYAVFPIWPADEDGVCTCLHKADCRNPGKHPVELPDYAPHGFKDASRDPSVIATWWAEDKPWNIGEDCGASGALVLDIDPKHGADPDAVIAAHGLEGYPTVRTGRAPAPSDKLPHSLEGVRGAHVYLANPGGALRNSKTAVPGVEFKGDGGYVIAPTSMHASGVRYEGDLPPVSELPEAPESVRALYEEARSAKSGEGVRSTSGGAIPEGERHSVLLSRLGALRRQGAGENELVVVAGAMAADCCDPPWPADEAVALARDVANRYPVGSTQPVSPGATAARVPAVLRWQTAAELRATVSPEPAWLWRHYLVPGAITMLAGKPKVGKSTLLCALIEGVSSDAGSLLGRPLRGGGVVLVTEEGASSLVHKLPDSDRVHVLTREAAWPRPGWAELIAAAVAEARRVGAILLVIDSLAFWAGFAEGQENDTGAAQSVMAALTAATSADLAVLLVHHQRKGGGDSGDAVRGAGALFGAVDLLVEIERVGEDAPAGQRRLVGTGRWPGTPAVLVVERDASRVGRGTQLDAWRVVGEAASRDETAGLALRERIVGALPEEAGPTEDEIADLLGTDKRKVSGPLRACCEEGSVGREGDGRKGSPFRYFRAGKNAAPKSRPYAAPATGQHPPEMLPLPYRGAASNFDSAPMPPVGRIASPENVPAEPPLNEAAAWTKQPIEPRDPLAIQNERIAARSASNPPKPSSRSCRQPEIALPNTPSLSTTLADEEPS